MVEHPPFETLDKPIYASGMFLTEGLGRRRFDLPRPVHLAWSFADPASPPKRLFRLRRWLNARQIADEAWERGQLDTYLTLDVTHHALTHLIDRFSRAYFIESVEHEIENGLNPGTFGHLSLGPGQRFAAKDRSLLVSSPAQSDLPTTR